MTTLPPILVTATDTESGEQWAFGDVCPSLEKGLTGDGVISWVKPDFVTGTDRLPPRFAHVTVEDDLGVIQTGRLVRRQPPPTDLCTGPSQYSAEGYYGAGRDRKDTDARPYGPVWTGTTRGLTPEAAVTDAVARWNGVTIGTVDPSGFTLPDTESFQGRAAADVVTAMSAFAAGLATPFVGTVRNGIFDWGPMDLSIRYRTLIADGAILAPSDDASRLYNHVLVLWGNGQYAEWPTTLSYQQIPTQVTLSVNAGAEVKTPAAALQLAQGLYARLGELELGWSWNFTIPMGTAVEDVETGLIYPYRMDAGYVLQVTDFEPETRYGTKHASPSELVVTSIRWDGQISQLTGTCGEIRDPSQFVRKVMYASNFSIGSPFAVQPGSVRTVRDAGKISVMGPFLSTAASTAAVTPGAITSPAIIDYKTPPVSAEHNQTLITNESPKPIKIEKGAQDASGFTTGLLDTGRFWSDVPPCEIDTWYLSASPSGSLTMEVYKAVEGSTGFTVDSSGDLTAGSLVLTASLSGAKFALHRFSTSTSPSSNSKPRIEAQSVLLYKLTSISGSTAFQITMNGNRIVPGHPTGANTAPAIGAKSP